MKMKVLKINNKKRKLIDKFLFQAGSSLKNFTYFEKREKSVLDNHVITYLGLIDDIPIAYGHLDKEENKVWLGIAVAESHLGLGLGKKMMKLLIVAAKKNKLNEIYLSVFKVN